MDGRRGQIPQLNTAKGQSETQSGSTTVLAVGGTGVAISLGGAFLP